MVSWSAGLLAVEDVARLPARRTSTPRPACRPRSRGRCRSAGDQLGEASGCRVTRTISNSSWRDWAKCSHRPRETSLPAGRQLVVEQLGDQRHADAAAGAGLGAGLDRRRRRSSRPRGSPSRMRPPVTLWHEHTPCRRRQRRQAPALRRAQASASGRGRGRPGPAGRPAPGTGWRRRRGRRRPPRPSASMTTRCGTSRRARRSTTSASPVGDAASPTHGDVDAEQLELGGQVGAGERPRRRRPAGGAPPRPSRSRARPARRPRPRWQATSPMA